MGRSSVLNRIFLYRLYMHVSRKYNFTEHRVFALRVTYRKLKKPLGQFWKWLLTKIRHLKILNGALDSIIVI